MPHNPFRHSFAFNPSPPTPPRSSSHSQRSTRSPLTRTHSQRSQRYQDPNPFADSYETVHRDPDQHFSFYSAQAAAPTATQPQPSQPPFPKLPPIPSQIPRLTHLLSTPTTSPLHAKLLKNLPFPLKLRSPLRRTLFPSSPFCALHAALTPPYISYVFEKVSEELWGNLERLVRAPFALDACTQALVQEVWAWRDVFDPSALSSDGCAVCVLGGLFTSAGPLGALGVLARGRKKKKRAYAEVVVFVGEGVDEQGRVDAGWRRGAVLAVLGDRKKARREGEGEEVRGGGTEERERAAKRRGYWGQRREGERVEMGGGLGEEDEEGEDQYDGQYDHESQYQHDDQYQHGDEYQHDGEGREDLEDWDDRRDKRSAEEPFYVDERNATASDRIAREYRKIMDAYGGERTRSGESGGLV